MLGSQLLASQYLMPVPTANTKDVAILALVEGSLASSSSSLSGRFLILVLQHGVDQVPVPLLTLLVEF